MRFRVTMKDPDTLWDSINDAARAAVSDLDIPNDVKAECAANRAHAARDVCSRWFEYGEYLTVEIDTCAGTCVVVEAA